MRILFNTLFMVFFLVGCTSTGTIISTPQSPYWIDVRTAKEYASGHLDGASNIPLKKIGEKISQVTTDKNAEIYLYCGSGKRAGMAEETLRQLGYTNVTNGGGYKAILERRKEQN